MVRWAPLTEHLREDGRDRVRLSYQELAEILEGDLPASAEDHRGVFWSNSAGNGYSRHWRRAGYRAVVRGLPADEVLFVRQELDGPDARVRIISSNAPDTSPHAARPARETNTSGPAAVILVGCVKTKADEPRPAAELYTSELFRRRRAYAEESDRPWRILSAEHGAVRPDTVLAPYDRYLAGEPAAYRRAWGRRVVDQLVEDFGDLSGMLFELHASRAYGDPIEAGLTRREAELRKPFEGLRFGEQLAWYDRVLEADREESIGDRRAEPAVPGGTGDRRAQAHIPAPPGTARVITEAFVEGRLDLPRRPGEPPPGWEGMPEVAASDRLRELGATDGEIRAFMTFISAMDRARDADVLWRRGAELYEDAAWVFRPREVIQHGFLDLADALRRTGVSQRHGPDCAAWRTIAESLASGSHDDPVRRVVREGEGSVPELLEAVQARTADGTSRYPLLRGDKIRIMWIRLLAHPGGADIDQLDELPVAVDVQVRRITEHLGLTDTAGRPLPEIRQQIQQAWEQDLGHHGAAGPAPLADTAGALDPALWFYAKWGCSHCDRIGRADPIGPVCSSCDLVQGSGAV